jgi:hypothetical protein
MQCIPHLQLGRLFKQFQAKRHVFWLQCVKTAELADVSAPSGGLHMIARTTRANVNELLD